MGELKQSPNHTGGLLLNVMQVIRRIDGCGCIWLLMTSRFRAFDAALRRVCSANELPCRFSSVQRR